MAYVETLTRYFEVSDGITGIWIGRNTHLWPGNAFSLLLVKPACHLQLRTHIHVKVSPNVDTCLENRLLAGDLDRIQNQDIDNQMILLQVIPELFHGIGTRNIAH